MYDKSSCVIFARQYTGNTDIKGIAKYIQSTTDKPYVGGVVLLNEGVLGHVAVIKDIVDDTLYVIEANYLPNQITERQIKLNYDRIRGYR